MKTRMLRTLVVIWAVLALVPIPLAHAQSATCVGDRVIDSEQWLDASVVRDFDTESRNLDRFGIKLYLYSAHTDDVVRGQYVGDLAKSLLDKHTCGMDANTVVIGVAPGIDPNGQYKEFGFTEIWYGSDALKSKMEALHLSGHTDNVMMELANSVDKTIVDNTYNAQVMREVRNFSAALNVVLAPATQPQQQAQPPVVVVIVPTAVPAKPTTPPEPAKPIDLSPFVGPCVVLLVLIVLGAIVYVIMQARQQSAKKRAAQRKAQSTRSQVTAMINGYGPFGTDGLRVEVETSIALVGDVDSSETADLQARLKSSTNKVELAAEQIKETARRKDMNADDSSLSASEYDEINSTYESMLRDVQAAYATAKDVKEAAEHLRETVGKAAEVIQSAEQTVGQCEQRVSAVVSQGFAAKDALANIAQAKQQLALASAAIGNKRYTKATDAATQAVSLAQEAADSAEKLPAEKRRLEELLEQLGQGIDNVTQVVRSAPQAMADLEQYNSASYADIIGNVQEAHNRVEWSEQNLKDMRAAINEQEYGDAQAEFDQAMGWLEEVRQLVEAIDARKGQIEEAHAKAADVLAEAKRSIVVALTAVKQQDRLMAESVETQLTEALKAAGQLEQAIQGQQPDYLAILRQSRELDTMADAVLRQTQEAAQNNARLAGRIAEQMREATSSFDAASRYIATHQRDIDPPTIKMIETAKTQLAAANEMLSNIDSGMYEEDALSKAYEQASTFTLAADKAADNALSAAKTDVQEAQIARQPVYVPSPTIVVSTHTHVNSGQSPSGWGSSNNDRPNRTSISSSSGTRASRSSSSGISSFGGTSASRSSSISSSSSSGTRARR